MHMKNISRLASLALIVLSFAASLWAFPHLPDVVTTHWNAAGQANGSMNKTFGLFFAPTMMIAIMGLILGLLRIDPMKKNVQEMKGKIDLLILCLMGFFAYIHGLTLAWNLGVRFDFGQWMIPPFAGLYIAIGTFIKNTKPNGLFGIRTPWTLSDEVVWKETHAFGAKLFQGGGIFMLLGIVFPSLAIYIVFISAIVAALGSVIYSYLAYAKRHS